MSSAPGGGGEIPTPTVPVLTETALKQQAEKAAQADATKDTQAEEASEAADAAVLGDPPATTSEGLIDKIDEVKAANGEEPVTPIASQPGDAAPRADADVREVETPQALDDTTAESYIRQHSDGAALNDGEVAGDVQKLKELKAEMEREGRPVVDWSDVERYGQEKTAREQAAQAQSASTEPAPSVQRTDQYPAANDEAGATHDVLTTPDGSVTSATNPTTADGTLGLTPPVDTAAQQEAQAKSQREAVTSWYQTNPAVKEMLGDQYDTFLQNHINADGTTLDVDVAIQDLSAKGDPSDGEKRLLQQMKEVRDIGGLQQAQQELADLKAKPEADQDAAAIKGAEEKVKQAENAQKNIDIRGELRSDSELVNWLASDEEGKKLHLDLESADISKEMASLVEKRKAETITGPEARLLHRFEEAQSLAKRRQAQEVLNDPAIARDSKEYTDAKNKFAEGDDAVKRKMVRESLRKDKGLTRLLKNEGYDIEDFDIDIAMPKLKRDGKLTPELKSRLEELSGNEDMAILRGKAKYVTSAEESDNLMKKMATAGSHERGFVRKSLEWVNDRLAGISGEEITNAWNQAKGYKKAIKQFQEELEDPDLNPLTEKTLKESLKNAKVNRRKALIEALGKRAGKSLLLFILIFSAAIIVGPAIAPAKLMDWTKGMGGGGH